jgi:hypothetical protein
MAIFKYLDDFLRGRNPNDFVFTVLDHITNEELTWDILDVLNEINIDRSADWVDYTKDDWFNGWDSRYYVILSIEDKGDKVYKPFEFMYM